MTKIGIRRLIAEDLGYGDKNDGFNRSAFSKNKAHFSRLRKIKACKLPGFRESIRSYEWYA